jgi:competence protein ComEA
VSRPGVYELDPSARVIDAVTAAGGSVAGADLDGLNLAAPLVDGQRVYVPHVGEVDPAAVPAGGAPAPTGLEGGAPRGPVNLNTATAAELESLPGVGPATAATIVDDRTRNGPFASVDDLERVPGIGPAKLAALREQVTV